MTSSKRRFKVVINSKEHGLYISSTPSSAARKAVSKLCADNKNKKVEFSLRETTQASNKKIYGPYTGYMQKLDKPVELEGRVIQYKPIVKRNNQVGGTFNVGDHVSSKNPVMIQNLNRRGRKNEYIVIKVFPKLGTILIRHINGDQDICLSLDKVEKIDSSGASAASTAAAASAASAASAAEVNNAKIWEELSAHVVQNEKNDNNGWFIMRNHDDNNYVKVKKNGTRSKMEKPVLVSSNNNSNNNFVVVNNRNK